ncbi:precorrin-6y C5,15-methyltransferase (decarboxylating) subunit CbiE [Alphaproteobacteria bacterium HT1-32]|nr:precorrin-6y C5,15-methyltransferase (decarboxylating) subunit CbiE [Alphaproteobacteria bacterium HT1-32]
MSAWLSIIGIGEDGLAGITPAARRLIDDAEVLVGGERHLAMAGDHPAERLTWRVPLTDTVADIAAQRGRRVCVLATGDPQSYGIGVTLGRSFDRSEMTIIPHLSAFSLASARLGWALQDVQCLTLHGRPLDLINLYVAPEQRLLILSENATTPGQVAERLTELGYGSSQMTVLSNMGGDREQLVQAETAADWADPAVSDLNTIAVECRAGPDARLMSRVPGLPDELFISDGQMTKREVRAMTLAALSPTPGALLWDVGAGSGSVGIEWMRAADRARAIAIEPKPERRARIAGNAAALGVPLLRIVEGTAPAALDGLPAPDAVFIGGGITSTGVISACWEALKPGGRLVANVVTLEGEQTIGRYHGTLGGELVRMNVARAEPVGPYQGWRPLMGVTQWRLDKSRR